MSYLWKHGKLLEEPLLVLVLHMHLNVPIVLRIQRFHETEISQLPNMVCYGRLFLPDSFACTDLQLTRSSHKCFCYVRLV